MPTAPLPPPLYLRVFLASPGDVADERTLARSVVEQLQYDPFLRGRVVLELVAWDMPAAGLPMQATLTPQEAVDRGLPRPSECDVVIAIFWSRMGTPLPESYKKPDGGRYQSGTEWELHDALTAADKNGKPVVLVYRRTEKVLLDPSAPGFMAQYEQWRQVQALFSSFVNPDGSMGRAYNSYSTPDHFRQRLEQHLRTVLRELLEVRRAARAVGPGVASTEASEPPLWKGSPFPGLRAFTPDDAPLFFGRGWEIDGLVQRLADPSHRFIAVVGASGSGKSSLVAAGLWPRLRSGALEGSRDWLRIRFTPGELGEDPFLALAAQLAPLTERAGVRTRELAARLAATPSSIGEVAQVALEGRPPLVRLLLCVDQFEELFSLVSPRYRDPFIALLVAAARDERLRTVATLRADFYARCVESLELAELLRTGSYPLATPGPGALLEMIARPAARAGLVFEERLAERILAETGTEPGALTLMAFALAELYEARERDGRLTHAAYERFEGVRGAIAKRAEVTFEALAPAVQEALASVFQELVEVDEQGRVTRRRALLRRMTASEPAARLVEALTEARLLVKGSEEGGEPVVEVSHEALLVSWPRLAAWIESAREELRLLRQLRLAALEWERQSRQEEFLWSDQRLTRVYAMLDRLRPELSRAERAFIRRATPAELIHELDNPNTAHTRRAVIGRYLADAGDPRPGVGLGANGLPEIVWCDVPGGKVSLVDAEGRVLLDCEVQSFQLAKFPITRTQYRAFLEAADGYQGSAWWEGLPRRERRVAEDYAGLGNHPAGDISWCDAVAFCRWLSARVGHEIRLPTEWEWQQGATGGNPANVYPWGPEWDPARANTDESNLNGATAVGMYPHGASSVGALDLSGTVWEWCLNEYLDITRTELGGEEPRAVRGASWNWNEEHARTHHRERDLPWYRGRGHGFRVVKP